MLEKSHPFSRKRIPGNAVPTAAELNSGGIGYLALVGTKFA
jgi:hypothetical protein